MIAKIKINDRTVDFDVLYRLSLNVYLSWTYVILPTLINNGLKFAGKSLYRATVFQLTNDSERDRGKEGGKGLSSLSNVASHTGK